MMQNRWPTLSVSIKTNIDRHKNDQLELYLAHMRTLYPGISKSEVVRLLLSQALDEATANTEWRNRYK